MKAQNIIGAFFVLFHLLIVMLPPRECYIHKHQVIEIIKDLKPHELLEPLPKTCEELKKELTL